jgi:uncharacterized protein
MTVYLNVPGVRIEEFTPGAPIAGVGTSTAAFIGVCADGPLNEATQITSWDNFRALFGAAPAPGFYLWYAVRGFFENGGTLCYVTNVSNAGFAGVELDDQQAAAAKTIVLRARKAGDQETKVTVAGDTHAVTGVNLAKPQGTFTKAAGRTVTLASAGDAANFRVGDQVVWTGIKPADSPATVARVQDATLLLDKNLSQSYNTAGKLSFPDLASGKGQSFRIDDDKAKGLLPGAVVVLKQGNATTVTGKVASVSADRSIPGKTTYRVTLRAPVGSTLKLGQGDPDVSLESQEFDVTVRGIVGENGITETFEKLSMNAEHPNYFARVINQGVGKTKASALITAAPFDPASAADQPVNRPKDLAETVLPGGSSGDPLALTETDFRAALDGLATLRDVNMVAMPDTPASPPAARSSLQGALVDHCQNLLNRFAIIDPKLGTLPVSESEDSLAVQRRAVDTKGGYAALYYPWLLVPPAAGDALVLVPPSGHIAGIYARTDHLRGVHKAPAGEDAMISGALGVERLVTDGDQDVLNRDGINVIRVFRPGGRPTVWGARTTATDTSWRYVNIRRLFLYLEGSIEEGIRWAVFEPNNLQLWQKLKRTISEFLERAWRDGALFGAKPSDAFYVRIDEGLNPFYEQQLGRLNIEIGIRPAYPAEFIIVRIGIWPGGSAVSEG